MTTTCQICARPIKAKSGLIAHHGYRRPGHGWQTRSCLGARSRPYEVACDRLPDVIGIIGDFIGRIERGLVDLRENPPESFTVQHAGKTRELIRPDTFDPMRGDNFTPNTYVHEFHMRRRDMLRQFVDADGDLRFMVERLDAWQEMVA